METGMGTMRMFYRWWMDMSPAVFIPFSVGLVLALQIPVFVVLELAGVDLDSIGGPEALKKLPPLVVFFTAVILVPILETALCQMLPIRLIQMLMKERAFWPAVLGSTLFFASLHLDYSVWYFLVILPAGLILALIYIRFQDRPESAFWMTTAVHAGRNALAVIAWWLTGG